MEGIRIHKVKRMKNIIYRKGTWGIRMLGVYIGKLKSRHKWCVGSSKKGFTLIELIVVMAVIAILVTLAVHSFSGYTKRAKMIKLKNDARVISDASDRYYIDHGDWPFLMIGGEHKRVLDEDLIEEIKQNIVYRAESF